MVAKITFSGDDLEPMLLTTSPPSLRRPNLAKLAPHIVLCRTGNAYQTHESMAVYVREVLGSYCQRVRGEMSDQSLPIFLIMDNCGSHKKDTLLHLYDALNIHVLWLPPHSSHFLQPLDSVMFARLNMKYREREAIKTRPKWVSKIIRIHQSWHECTRRLNVRGAWSAAAIIHTASELPEWLIDGISIARKLEEHCKPPSPGVPDEMPTLPCPPLMTFCAGWPVSGRDQVTGDWFRFGSGSPESHQNTKPFAERRRTRRAYHVSLSPEGKTQHARGPRSAARVVFRECVSPDGWVPAPRKRTEMLSHDCTFRCKNLGFEYRDRPHLDIMSISTNAGRAVGTSALSFPIGEDEAA
jgi:hypothetical protein